MQTVLAEPPRPAPTSRQTHAPDQEGRQVAPGGAARSMAGVDAMVERVAPR